MSRNQQLSTTSQLSYKELQSALRTAKEQGLTSIKLNSKQSVLQAEYDRITAAHDAVQAPRTKVAEETVTVETLNGQHTALTCDINAGYIRSVTGYGWELCETERELEACIKHTNRGYINTVHEYEYAYPLTCQYVAPPVQAKLTDAVESSCYPFNKNTVKVKNKQGLSVATTHNKQTKERFTTRVLPAMSPKRAPSWLCKPVTVYIIDGVDYLLYELEMQLKGQVCELACEFTAPAVVSNAVIDSIESYGSNRQPGLPPTTDDIAAATSASKTNERKLAANAAPRLQTAARKDRVSNARPATPIVNSAKDSPKAKLTYSQEPASPYFIDTTKAARYTKGLGATELQAARNLEDAVRGARRGLAAVIDIAKGFHAAQVQRALKVA